MTFFGAAPAWFVVAAIVAGLGCARTASPAASRAAVPRTVPAPVHDWAIDLAARLPAGADRCEVARPDLLGAEERALYAPMAQGSPVAWREELRVVAFARAERERRPDGTPAEVTLLRAEASEAQVRSVLGPASGLDLRWDAEVAACGPDACPTAARFVEPGVVRLARGAWPAVRAAKGVSPRCRALVEAYPDAIEAWARREHALHPAGDEGTPLRSHVLVRRRADGVCIEREDLMASLAAAQRAVDAQSSGVGVPPFLAGFGVEGRRRQEDSAVLFDIDVRWEDLRFARDDRERLADAGRYADALERLEPDERIDPNALDAVVAQIEARVELLELGRVPDAAVLASTRMLLERALAAHPDDARLAALRERVVRHTAAHRTR